MTQQSRPPVKLAIMFPGYSRASYVAICHGNERIATLLDHFVYYASVKIEREKLENWNFVTLEGKEWTHAAILSHVPIHSETTLIAYLDKLTAWGFVESARYGRSFTVNLTRIQEAINHPPVREKRPKTGGRAAGECSNVSNLKHSALQEKVSKLEKYVSELELKVSKLEQIVSKSELWNLPSAPSEMRAEGQSDTPPVSYCPITDHTDLVVLRTAYADALDTHRAPLSEIALDEDETPTPDRRAVADGALSETPSQQRQEATPPPPAASVNPGETDGATATRNPRRGAPRASGARKPKAAKPEPVDPARIEATIACMEETIRELTGDQDFSYARTRRAASDIADLLRGRQVAPSRLKAAMTKMYHTPPDKRSGFDWKENMTVHAVCNNFDRFCIAVVSNPAAVARSKYANPDSKDGSWPDGKYFEDGTFLQPKQRPDEPIDKYYSRMMVEDGDARLAQAYAAQLPTSAPQYAPVQA